jgi:hypothetical protein
MEYTINNRCKYSNKTIYIYEYMKAKHERWPHMEKAQTAAYQPKHVR